MDPSSDRERRKRLAASDRSSFELTFVIPDRRIGLKGFFTGRSVCWKSCDREAGAHSHRCEGFLCRGGIAVDIFWVAQARSYRCRKSTEEGLDQEFNSLDAQRDACAAFISSQAGMGWRLVADHYDDGGISGGTMERPALKRLLQDIRDRKVDVVAVYKIDRLTRSLLDFDKPPDRTCARKCREEQIAMTREELIKELERLEPSAEAHAIYLRQDDAKLAAAIGA